MTVYIDYKNYLSLFRNSDDIEKQKRVFQLLKKQVDIHFNFETEKLDDDEYILLTEFQDGMISKITDGKDIINPRPIKENSFPCKSSIYLLDDENVSDFKGKYNVIIAGVNEEVDVLSSLNIDLDDYGFHVELEIGGKYFPDWSIINKFVRPFSTLLFVDRYMFSGKELSGNIGLFDYNIGAILENFYQYKNSKSTLVFVYRIVDSNDPKYQELGPDFEKIKSKIKNLVKATNKYCPSPEIIFIGVPKDRIADEHDRHIISNYMRIKSGDSLIYFNSKNEHISNSKMIDFYSLGKRDYRTNTNAILEKISDIIIQTYNKYPQFCSVPKNIKLQELFKF